MRKNEHVNYGYDNIQGDPPTGKMYITSSLETFDNYEKEDNTKASQELACSAGVCEVVDI